jgi:hypothetical protein
LDMHSGFRHDVRTTSVEVRHPCITRSTCTGSVPPTRDVHSSMRCRERNTLTSVTCSSFTERAHIRAEAARFFATSCWQSSQARSEARSRRFTPPLDRKEAAARPWYSSVVGEPTHDAHRAGAYTRSRHASILATMETRTIPIARLTRPTKTGTLPHHDDARLPHINPPAIAALPRQV